MSAEYLHVVERLDRADSHLVSINDIRVGLILAARRRPDVEVALFLADHDLRAHAAREGRTSPPYIPDALVELVLPGGARQGLVVEYDAGTEHAKQFSPKVETLRVLFERNLPVWGLHLWRPVVVAETKARLRALSSMIVAGGGGDLWLAALQAPFVADPFGPVFATAAAVAATPPALTPTFGGRLVPRPTGVR
ncbi:MAG: replication-relaxation family protein [Polyangiales bacterium]